MQKNANILTFEKKILTCLLMYIVKLCICGQNVEKNPNANATNEAIVAMPTSAIAIHGGHKAAGYMGGHLGPVRGAVVHHERGEHPGHLV